MSSSVIALSRACGIRSQVPGVRWLGTTSVLSKNLRSGMYKTTHKRTKPLTYEQAQAPYLIGVTKSWNSWNTSNLKGEEEQTALTTLEDMFIRQFMYGTWHNMFVTELIIKRRHNMVILSGLINRLSKMNKVYFLQGYTEELLSHLLKRPVKVEIQTVDSIKDMYFKWI